MQRLVLLLLAGCYAPQVTAGSPCQTDSDCPSSLVCSAASKTCEHENAAPDASNEQTMRTCWEAWLAGVPTFGTIRRIDELSSTAGESDASLAENDLAIYFERSDMTTMGSDIFRATRSTLTSPWQGAAIVGAFQSASTDSRAGLALNGTLAVFASTRMGGAGGSDLYYATQASGGWSTPDQLLLANVNTTDNQFDPELSPDGLVLYYSATSSTGQQLVMARRNAVTDAFGMPSTITPPGSKGASFDPTISFDGRVLLYASGDTGTPADLYMATRANIDAPFGNAQVLSAISSPQLDGDPELSQDGCHVIFDSTRNGNRDFYTVDVIP